MADTSDYIDSTQVSKPGKNVNVKHGLTKQQRSLLHFIQQYHTARGIMPTFDLMKDALGLASKSGVHRLLTALETRGHIERLPYRARAMRFVIGDDDVATGRAIEIVLERCELSAIAERELRLHLKLWRGAADASVRGAA